MREENETLIYLPQNYFSLKHHQTLLTIPFHQAAKLFPPPSPPSQKQHTFSLKLKSIHRQSRRPFHSNILKLSFPFKPKGDSRPLRRSTPEFSCVCRLRPLPPPPPPHHHPPSCTRRKTHERTRPSENRLARVYPAADPFPRDTRRVAECVGAWGTFGDRRQPPSSPSLHRSLPAKGILCGSQFRAIYPWLRAIQRRGEARRTGIETMTISSKR